MTRYADLSRYAYMPDSVPDGVVAVNVGWLEAGDTFPEGEVPREFVTSLGVLCRDDRQMVTRGWKGCGFDHTDGEIAYPVTAQVGADEVVLGSAEVRVAAEDGTWLIAPNLVLHYVTVHGYRPPQPFIEAVTARRSVRPAAR
jgi:hypothetical protein